MSRTIYRTGSRQRIQRARDSWRDALMNRGVKNPIKIQQQQVPYSPHSCLAGERHYCNDPRCKARIDGRYSVRADGTVIRHE